MPWALGAAGLLLLLVGGRLVRPALALVGVAMGALAGWVVGSAAPESTSGDHLALVAAAVGSVAGGVLGLCLFRPVIALGAAAACGMAAALGAALWLGAVSPAELAAGASPSRGPTLKTQAQELLAESIAQRGVEGATLSDARHLTGPNNALAESAERAWTLVASEAGQRWERVDARSRMRIVGVTVLGALAGLVVGGLGPRRVVAVLSAGVGSAVLVGLAPAAIPRLGVGAPEPMAWVGLWAVLAITGAAVQLAAMRRRRGAPQPPPSA